MDFSGYLDQVHKNAEFIKSQTMTAGQGDTVDSITAAFIAKLPYPRLEQNDGLVRPFAEEIIRRRDAQ